MTKSKYLLILLIIFFFSCKEQDSKIQKLKLTDEQFLKIESQREELLKEKNILISKMDSINDIILELENEIYGNDIKYTLVSSQKVEVIDFEHFIQVQGNVNTDNNILIHPETPGTVKEVLVKEGDKVKKGQKLYMLDTDVLDENIREKESQLKLANELYEKQKKLWDRKIGSEIEYLRTESNKLSLEASLKAIKSQREKMVIKSPFSGIIDEIFIKKGELALAQSPLVRILDLSSMYIEGYISEDYISKIKKGTDVEIENLDLGLKFRAEVSQVGSIIDPMNRSFRIKIDVSGNKDVSLKPNLTVSLNVKDFEKKEAIVIPSKAINVDIDENSYVYVLDEDKTISLVKKKIIKVEKAYKGKSYISEGLEKQDIIVIKGADRIKDGEKVRVYEK